MVTNGDALMASLNGCESHSLQFEESANGNNIVTALNNATAQLALFYAVLENNINTVIHISGNVQ